jgi:multidrug efflux pump subunit AcrA (membrane-fusion protein)
MNSFPSNSILLGRRYVAPDGASVYAWPADNRRFLMVLQNALDLQPAADSSTAGIPSSGVVFVSMENQAAAEQALVELREQNGEVMVCAVGATTTKLADICIAEQEGEVKKIFPKLASGEIKTPLAKRMIRLGSISAAVGVMILAGWYLRKMQSSPNGTEWNKKAKLPDSVATSTEKQRGGNKENTADSQPQPPKQPVQGQIRYQHCLMSMPREGEIIEVHVAEGQTIAIGDLLLEVLDPAKLAAAKVLEQQASILEGELENSRRLFEESQVVLAEASTQKQQAAISELFDLNQAAVTKIKELQSVTDQVNETKKWVAFWQEKIDRNSSAASTYRKPLGLQKMELVNNQAMHANLVNNLKRTQLRISALDNITKPDNSNLQAAEAGFSNAQSESELRLEQIKSETARAQAEANIQITAQSAGLITSVRAERGMTVGKGQPLMAIRRTDLAPEVIAFPESTDGIRKGMRVSISNTASSFFATGLVLEIGSPENTPAVRIKLDDFDGSLPPEGAEVWITRPPKK